MQTLRWKKPMMQCQLSIINLCRAFSVGGVVAVAIVSFALGMLL